MQVAGAADLGEELLRGRGFGDGLCGRRAGGGAGESGVTEVEGQDVDWG